MLEQQDYERLMHRLRAKASDDLVLWAEHMRQLVHVDGEQAYGEEERIRAQAMAVVYRDMAKLFRGDLVQDAEQAQARDSAALTKQ